MRKVQIRSTGSGPDGLNWPATRGGATSTRYVQSTTTTSDLASARSPSLIVIIAAINTFMIIMISNSSSSNNDNDYSSLRCVRYITAGRVASAPVPGVGSSGNMTAESTKNRALAQG